MINAAVLLLILKNNHILFIKRAKNLKKHSGEVSFPGGKFDKRYDNSLLDTAIRETYEEIGISSNYFRVIGTLPPQQTVATNFIVHTFIAVEVENSFELNFTINSREVESIITIPLEHFYNKKYKVSVPLKLCGKFYLNTFYYYNNILIWGATSRILDDFLKYYKNHDRFK